MKTDYDAIATYYDRYRTMTPAALRFWLKRLVSFGCIAPDMPVLDLGCGTGRFAIPMRQQVGARVYALDRSPEMIRQALGKDGSSDVWWAVGDAYALPYADDAFACVFMILVVHHLEDRPRALAEVLRVLRPGGLLVIWTASHPQIRRFFLGPFFPSLTSIDLARFPDIKGLMAQMRTLGFTRVRRRAVTRRETVSATEILDRVRHRYISTLSLIPEEEFAAGVEAFSRYLAALPGRRLTRAYRYTFVTGEKPPGQR